MTKTTSHTGKAILIYVLTAFTIGLITGWIRYWAGFYVLLQGTITGLLIPWVSHRFPSGREKIPGDASFKLAILLFSLFMIGQATGFGLAQPWFDPAGWLMRVIEGKTSESVFGIFSTGGVVHEFYSNGLNDGFWLILSIFDMLFMFFFLLISLPAKANKKRS